MFLRYFLLKYFLLCAFFLNHSVGKLIADQAEQHWRDFYAITIPKSGTFLFIKLMKMMLDADFEGPPAPNYSQFTFPDEIPEVSDEVFEQALLKLKNGKTYPLCHTNFTELLLRVRKTHPEYTPIIMIRDLRDVLVSCVYFQWYEIHCEIGPSTFAQKLSFLIHLGHSRTQNKILNIYRYAEEALPWLKEPGVLICRYEDLVGEKGGGSLELQEKSIIEIANALGVPVNENQLESFINDLFGTSKGPQMPTTFRQGNIGSWKTHFDQENLDAFNEKWHHLQSALGYY